MNISFNVLKWAAEECERQQSGEMSVFNMCRAWDYATLISGKVELQDIFIMASRIEPKKVSGPEYFRCVPVSFRNAGVSLHPSLIRSAMNSLLRYQPHTDNVDLDFWYKEFEVIHPFIDGNGRVGSVLWNYFNGSLDNPVAPPDLFGN